VLSFKFAELYDSTNILHIYTTETEKYTNIKKKVPVMLFADKKIVGNQGVTLAKILATTDSQNISCTGLFLTSILAKF